jgi:predicted nucleic acid-binding protein
LEVTRLLLDSGGLSALAAAEETSRRIVADAIRDGAPVVIPVAAIAESISGNGPHDAAINRVIKYIGTVAELSEELARASGLLRYMTGLLDVADASIVATADAVAGTGILTGDERHLGALAGVHSRSTIVSTKASRRTI